jgi:serine/threonine protein kinase
MYRAPFFASKLGEGAFGVVRKATDRTTGRLYAIKIVNRSSLNEKMEFALRDEITILGNLRHEHVMALHDSVATIDKYYLITEYLEGGELFDRIVDKCSYTESEALDVCAVLFGALDHVNSRGIAHRDLKPENLLLASRASDTDIKIADFGFARYAPDDGSLRTMCGTPGYVAPEILRREGYGTKCDLWSMGVIVFILIGGYPPFYGRTPRRIFELTSAGRFAFDPEYWGDISQSCKDAICALLELDPARRASAGEILSHP